MWQKIKSFLQFYFRSGTIYNVQSPFVYDFVTHVLDTSKEYYMFKKLEAIRNQLLTSDMIAHPIDFGAGSKKNTTKGNTKIKDIAASAVSSKKKCRILFNLVNYYQPENVLELGTSLGLSSAYIASARHASQIHTLEGNPQIADIAKDIHAQSDLHNIKIVTGNFNETLVPTLKTMHKIDLAFLDGNHRYEPTLQYFQTILEYCHDDSILVFDDIYWSPEMTKAWEEIKKNQRVQLTIDIFDLGIVFLKPKLSKEDISHISFWAKPWRIGLFGK